MSELISREEAIDAVKNVRLEIVISGRRGFTRFNKELQEVVNHLLEAQEKALKELKPKEFEEKQKKTEKRCSNCDWKDGDYCPHMLDCKKYSLWAPKQAKKYQEAADDSSSGSRCQERSEEAADDCSGR